MNNGVTIYHNPACGTSRNVLVHLREAGLDPVVIEYLKTPPDRATIEDLVRRTGRPARDLLREKEALCEELGLRDPSVADAMIIDQMMKHPILINRPIVVTPDTVQLCRPSETVLPLIAALTQTRG